MRNSSVAVSSLSAKCLNSVMAGRAVSVSGLSTSCLNICTVQLYSVAVSSFTLSCSAKLLSTVMAGFAVSSSDKNKRSVASE